LGVSSADFHVSHIDFAVGFTGFQQEYVRRFLHHDKLLFEIRCKVRGDFPPVYQSAEATRRHYRSNSKTVDKSMDNSPFFISYFAGKLNKRISKDAQKHGYAE
jgi:hypothetical protein